MPQSTPLPALFLPLAIMFHQETFDQVASTQARSGLRKFVGKFGESRFSETDVLLALERRARLLRGLTLDSLRLAVTSKLLFIEAQTAEVVPLSGTAPTVAGAVRPMVRNAEKLGGWCGAVTLYELANLLRVGF